MEPHDPFKQLRAEFPAEQVGKLPRLVCKACSDSRDKHCDKHAKKKCGECSNYITEAHIHLDYVGHAAVTDRLLQVDPRWTWDFQATNPDGSPVVMTSGLADPAAKVGLWIKLTVADVTRPGFGEGKNFKEAIGDALRNAAMRFGVGLDLWSKEDLSGHDDVSSNGPSSQTAAPGRQGAAVASGEEAAAPAATPDELAKLDRLIGNLAKVDDDRDWPSYASDTANVQFGHGLDKLTSPEVLKLAQELPKGLDALGRAKLKELQTAVVA